MIVWTKIQSYYDSFKWYFHSKYNDVILILHSKNNDNNNVNVNYYGNIHGKNWCYYHLTHIANKFWVFTIKIPRNLIIEHVLYNGDSSM